MNGIAVYLPADDWNKVLAILAQAPWNVANPLIMAMAEQLRTQGPGGGPPTSPRPNGEDVARQ